MGENILSNNTLVAQPISPIHIGSGQRLSSMEYIHENNTWLVLDENKFLNWLLEDPSGRRAADFDGLISRRVHTENQNYGRQTESVNMATYLRNQHVDLKQLAAYQISSNVNRPPRDRDTVSTFIKTIDNEPFIPGSSLKGTLRSRLLRGYLLEHPEQQEEFSREVEKTASTPDRNNRPSGKSAGPEIEARVFVKPGVKPARRSNYDLNRVLVIGDSQPKSQGSLEFVEVKILSVQGGRLGEKSFSNYLEVLRVPTPQSPINLRFPVSWQVFLLGQNGLANELGFAPLQKMLLYLPEYCRAASFELFEQEIKFFHEHKEGDLAGWYEEKRSILRQREDLFCLPIGWGTGYDAKTITDLLNISAFRVVADFCKNTKGLGRPGNQRGNEWLGAALSPKSRRVVVRPDGKKEPLGWMLLKFQSDDEEGDWLTSERKKYIAERPIIEIRTQAGSGTPAQQTISNSNISSAPKPVPVAPTTPSAPVTKATVPPKSAIIQSFTSLPQVGQRFRGEFISVENEGCYVEIPGLDSDCVAIGLGPILQPHPRANARLICEVIELKPDPRKKGLTLVICRFE